MTRHSASKEAQDRANKKYKENNYKRFLVQLRYDKDQEIINELDDAVRKYGSKRALIHEWYDAWRAANK